MPPGRCARAVALVLCKAATARRADQAPPAVTGILPPLPSSPSSRVAPVTGLAEAERHRTVRHSDAVARMAALVAPAALVVMIHRELSRRRSQRRRSKLCSGGSGGGGLLAVAAAPAPGLLGPSLLDLEALDSWSPHLFYLPGDAYSMEALADCFALVGGARLPLHCQVGACSPEGSLASALVPASPPLFAALHQSHCPAHDRHHLPPTLCSTRCWRLRRRCCGRCLWRRRRPAAPAPATRCAGWAGERVGRVRV